MMCSKSSRVWATLVIRMSRKRKEKAAAQELEEANAQSATVPSQHAARGLMVACLGLGLWLLQRTWFKWADVLVDYGRELYVPWRLSEGDVLYRDIAYFNGPLSPHWNALWFSLFGTGYSVQVGVNLALLGVFIVLIYRMLTRLGNATTAGLTLLFALPVFVFAHNAGIANYNFVSPYSHEMTHGLLLAILALGASMRVEPSSPQARRQLITTGMFLGLLFLTKAEIFAATTLGVAVILGGGLFAAKANAASWRSAVTAVLGATLAVPVVAFVLLFFAMPAGLAAYSVLGSWTGIFGSEVSDLPFYQVGMGLDNPSARIELMGASFGILALAFVPGLVLDLAVRLGSKKSLAWTLATVVAIATFAIWRTSEVFAERLALPLPLLLGVIVLVLGARLITCSDPVQRRLFAARTGFAVFALAMLAKMILNVRFEHYGFVLAFPAMAVVFLATTAWLPSWVRAKGGSGLLVAASALGVFAAVATQRWEGTEAMLARKVNEVGEGRDRMWTDSRGLYVQSALDQIEEQFAPDDELLVIPEGITINYWSRRKIAIPYTNYMPPELILYGEQTLLEALETNPPAGVVIVHKNTAEYGFPLFGTDYGAEMMKWVMSRYSPVYMDQRGGPPLRAGTSFGLGILKPK